MRQLFTLDFKSYIMCLSSLSLKTIKYIMQCQHFQDTRGAQLPRNLQLFAADDLLEVFKDLIGMKKM